MAPKRNVNVRKMTKGESVVIAGKPDELLHCAAESVEWLEAASSDGEQVAKKFSMTGYTGGSMRIAMYYDPVVVDLAGLQLAGETIPALKDHDTAQIVGHGEPTISAQTVKMTGLVSGGGPAAQEVLTSSGRGFPWKASVGVQVMKREYVSEGATAKANGRTFTGPVNIIRGGVLQEISFVAIGADGKTKVSVAATAANSQKETTMEFSEWVKAEGFDPDSLTEKQEAFLKAMYEKDDSGDVDPPKAKLDAVQDGPPVQAAPKPVDMTAVANEATETVRAAAAKENARLVMVATLCDEYADRIEPKPLAEIRAKAIKDGWDRKDTELELLRAGRPTAPAAHMPKLETTSEVLEAACAVSGKLDGVEKQFKPEVLEAAHKAFKGAVGLQELLIHAAWANGCPHRLFRGHEKDVMRYAFRPDIMAAGFSTVDIDGILSNTANKFLNAGYMSVERTWRNICAVRNVRDFKTVTSYALTGDMQYKLVPPGGDIDHGTLGEVSFTNKADTYARMLAITRTDIINDDLGAISTIPRALGRGSGLKVNDVFWTAFCDNTSFFTAARANYYADAAAPLSITSLTVVEQMFMDQTDPDSKPLGLIPRILLVPTGNSALAAQLFAALEIRDTTASTKYPVANPHAGKFRNEVSTYLGNASYGNSQLAWYLLADPQDAAVIEVCFLNGQEAPTIETSEADFSTLGIQMRGYHDFGVSKQDYRGGVKSKGAA